MIGIKIKLFSSNNLHLRIVNLLFSTKQLRVKKKYAFAALKKITRRNKENINPSKQTHLLRGENIHFPSCSFASFHFPTMRHVASSTAHAASFIVVHTVNQLTCSEDSPRVCDIMTSQIFRRFDSLCKWVWIRHLPNLDVLDRIIKVIFK